MKFKGWRGRHTVRMHAFHRAIQNSCNFTQCYKIEYFPKLNSLSLWHSTNKNNRARCFATLFNYNLFEKFSRKLRFYNK